MMNMVDIADKAGFMVTKAVVGPIGLSENYYYLVHEEKLHHAIVTEKCGRYELELRLENKDKLEFKDISVEELANILANADNLKKNVKLEIKINGFNKDELKSGDVLCVECSGKLHKYLIVNIPYSDELYDLLDLTENSTSQYGLLGYQEGHPWDCIKLQYKDEEFISVSVITSQEYNALVDYAYDNGFEYQKPVSMTLDDIEKLLGYKINLV